MKTPNTRARRICASPSPLPRLELEHDRASPAQRSWLEHRPARAAATRRATGGPGCCWPAAASARRGPARRRSICWARAGSARRIAVVAPTIADVRDLSVAALRAAAGPDVSYTETRHFRLRWPNGAEALGFSAEDPASLRGYEFDAAWCDELAAWRYPEAYDQLQFGLRAPGARQIVTTTPRPVRLVRELLADPSTVVTRGRTLDNAANLDPATLRYYFARYGGTRLGRQELDAELLDDVPGALWTRDRIDELRVAARARAGPDRGRGRSGGIEQRGRGRDRHRRGGQGRRWAGLPARRSVLPREPRRLGPAGRRGSHGPGEPIGSWPRSTRAATSSRRRSGR